MSLDVYLTVKRDEVPEASKAVALLREHGFDEFATEIEARHDCSESECLFSANVTHNLGSMARAAGIYDACWRPDEVAIKKARDLVLPLRAGLEWLVSHPDEARQFNPRNGWGCYEDFVNWMRAYLSACEEWPHADVRASR